MGSLATHTFWKHRVYTGGLADLSAARADLAADLTGFDPDSVDTLRLCLNELQANACKYGRPGGEVARCLSMTDRRTLALTVSNEQGGDTVPRIPVERTESEWEWAEGQRGLLLVENLASTWGHYSWPHWSRLGTLVWATFAVDPAKVPPTAPPYAFTR